MIIWHDGAWLDETESAIGIGDRGFTLGDGLFETMLWDGGRIHRFARHLARLKASSAALGLPAPDAHEMEIAAHEIVTLNDLEDARAAIRVVWSAGPGPRGLARPAQMQPTLFVTIAPSPKATSPIMLATSQIRRSESAPSARHKTLSYIDNVMARAEAVRAGAGEALLLNSRGEVAGGAASNLFLVIGGRLVTPPSEDGALAGTMRAAVLEALPEIAVRSISAAELARAEAIAISNALEGVRAASHCDGRALAGDHPQIKILQQASAA